MAVAQILLVDDEPDILEILKDNLESADFRIMTAQDGLAALDVFEEHHPDLVVLDIKMPGLSGIEVLKRIRTKHPNQLVVMITAFGTVEQAVEAMKAGAYDFITKPLDPDHVRMVVDKALEKRRLTDEVQYLRAELKNTFDEIIGESEALIKALKTVEQVAHSDSTVLIRGETGTGKELIARALHEKSPRCSKPFVVVNCSAIPATLMESELFGHEKGAFTGATSRRLGRFEQAADGTLFLDEIGDVGMEVQSRFLRAIEEKSFSRVGGTETVDVSVRIVAATNRNLEEDIEANRFRKDLFYRLNVVPISLPPLRERWGDIPVLADYFLKKHSVINKKPIKSIDQEVLNLLARYHWPGNIRELNNVIERAVLTTQGDMLLPKHFSQIIRPDVKETPVSFDNCLDEYAKGMIFEALQKSNWNQSQAARELNITEKKLRDRMKKYGIQKPV
jgi:two-component system response regulator AtoC